MPEGWGEHLAACNRYETLRASIVARADSITEEDPDYQEYRRLQLQLKGPGAKFPYVSPKRQALPSPIDEPDHSLTLDGAAAEFPRQSKFWAWYEGYLRSETWRFRRAAALQRDGHWCQACLRQSATDVHHLTYKHVGAEPLFDLISVCRACHDSLHAAEKGRKPWL